MLVNTVGKGEIARYEQFILFPQYFQKTRKNQGLYGKELKDYHFDSVNSNSYAPNFN